MAQAFSRWFTGGLPGFPVVFAWTSAGPWGSPGALLVVVFILVIMAVVLYDRVGI